MFEVFAVQWHDYRGPRVGNADVPYYYRRAFSNERDPRLLLLTVHAFECFYDSSRNIQMELFTCVRETLNFVKSPSCVSGYRILYAVDNNFTGGREKRKKGNF